MKLPSFRGSVRAELRAGRRGGEPELDQRIARDPPDRLSIHLESPVEPAHGRLVEPAAQLGQRRDRGRPPRGEIAAHQGRRLVGRKEPLVVSQHHQIVPRDETVGGVAVDHVHLGCGQRLILHRGKQRPHLGESHAVGSSEAGKPVRPSDEIGRQPGAERWSRPRQVAQRREAVAHRGLPPHGDGVGVLEAQRREPARVPAAAELAAHPVEHLCGIGYRLLTENREEPRAGVLGIDVG